MRAIVRDLLREAEIREPLVKETATTTRPVRRAPAAPASASGPMMKKKRRAVQQ